MAWDTVVIGSGPGGLTAAVALARAGQKVLVLEQHYLPGGWTHSFSLGGYQFSPGVHYIGELDVGHGVRHLFEGLGVARHLQFCELNPDGFDHILIAGQRIDQPKGLDRWLARLHERFPHERAGIDRYFKTLTQVINDVTRVGSMLSFPQILTVPFRAPTLFRWGFSTLDALLSSCVRDPLLKAMLSAQSGNHGLGPSRISLALHAAMTAHYLPGAFYPRGGAKSIPRAFIKELSRLGGDIRVKTRVSRILVEDKRAVGVRLDSGETIRAANVVCNADPAVTYGKLLAPEHCKSQIRKVKRTEYTVSLVSIFCAVDMDLKALGYDSGNYWWYRNTDVNGLYARMGRELPGVEVDGLFLTITTLKDPSHRAHGHHTLEMFTFVPYAPFERWRSQTGERDEDYQRLKKSIADKMLEAAEHIIPNLRQHLKFLEVGTPLTNDFYCETHRGAAYGRASTPWQVGPFAFSQRGPVANLHLCGASTISHGVAVAAMSGLVAAGQVLGRSPGELLGPPDGSLQILPADRPEDWPRERAVDQADPPDRAPSLG